MSALLCMIPSTFMLIISVVVPFFDNALEKKEEHLEFMELLHSLGGFSLKGRPSIQQTKALCRKKKDR